MLFPTDMDDERRGSQERQAREGGTKRREEKRKKEKEGKKKKRDVEIYQTSMAADQCRGPRRLTDHTPAGGALNRPLSACRLVHAWVLPGHTPDIRSWFWLRTTNTTRQDQNSSFWQTRRDAEADRRIGSAFICATSASPQRAGPLTGVRRPVAGAVLAPWRNFLHQLIGTSGAGEQPSLPPAAAIRIYRWASWPVEKEKGSGEGADGGRRREKGERVALLLPEGLLIFSMPNERRRGSEC